MENQNSAREKLLKKVRNALLEQSDNPYNHADFEAPLFKESQALDIEFAEQFNANGGQFIYCEDPKDFIVQLEAIRQENNWNGIHIMDDDLRLLFEKTGFDHYSLEYSEETSQANLALCEGLIARTGSILVSSEQKESKSFYYNTENLLFTASIKHITSDLQTALNQLDEKYDKTPADISVLTRPDNLRNHVKQDGEAVYGPKNFYLFLIDK